MKEAREAEELKAELGLGGNGEGGDFVFPCVNFEKLSGF